MGFNPDTELVTGPAFARFRFYLVTRQGLAARNLKELVEMARANPGKITYGSSGNGTPPHLVAETFLKAAGIKAVHVEFDGKVILDKGQFDSKPVWDGKLRAYR